MLKLIETDKKKKLRKLIADRNYRFKKLSPSQRRVRIAKDVIELLSKKKITAAHQGYFLVRERKNSFMNSLDYIDDEHQLHEVIESNHCEVCALGGMLAATVLRTDGFSASNSVDGFQVKLKLKEHFDAAQLELIESTFEESTGFMTRTLSLEEEEKIFSFCKENSTPKKRLIKIMENIIENDGEFILP